MKAIYEEKTKVEDYWLKIQDPLYFFQWVSDGVLSSLNEYGILKFFNTTYLLNTTQALWTFEMPISMAFPTLEGKDPLHVFHWAYENMYNGINEYAIIPLFNATSNLLKASQSLWTMEMPISISFSPLEGIDPLRFFHLVYEEVQRGLEYGTLYFFNVTSFINTSLWTFEMPISFPSFTLEGTDTFQYFHWVYEESLSGLNRSGILNVFNITTHALWNFEMPMSISFPTLEGIDPLLFFHWIYEETLNALNNSGVLNLFNITSFWDTSHALWDFEIPISITLPTMPTLPTLPSLDSIDPLSFFHWIYEEVQSGLHKYGVFNFFNTTSFWNTTRGLWNVELPIFISLPTLESLDPLPLFQWVFEEMYNGLNTYGITKFFNTSSFWNATHSFWSIETSVFDYFPTLESIDPRCFFHWVYEEVHNSLNKYGTFNFFNATSFLTAARDLCTFEVPISISFAWLESIDPLYFFHWVYEEAKNGLDKFGILNFFNTTSFWNATHALWNFEMPISISFPTLEGTDLLRFFQQLYEEVLNSLKEYVFPYIFDSPASDDKSPGYAASEEKTAQVHGQ
ncbi:hypothetical protein XELAEV_18027014mg [Xenopus laevis]|uniref:Uncharacterized protein n=1 Tax=Xenopus laevis TaxID=8355 RepID=A0A974CVH5_XENLA|nr:hypothetical protein XELAEV_18027014mg [Xenopus laevis]